MRAKLNARKSVFAKLVGRRSTRSAKLKRQPRLLGDRLVVGLRTLTPPTGVRIPLPQPENEKAPLVGAFSFSRSGRVGFQKPVRPTQRRRRMLAGRAEGPTQSLSPSQKTKRPPNGGLFVFKPSASAFLPERPFKSLQRHRRDLDSRLIQAEGEPLRTGKRPLCQEHRRNDSNEPEYEVESGLDLQLTTLQSLTRNYPEGCQRMSESAL